MKSFKGEFDIRLFSDLIETILCSRITRKSNINEQITLTIKNLKSERRDDLFNLNSGIQTISKLHEGSDFNVNSMLKKHFMSHSANKYSIYLQIFTLHNNKQQQIFDGKYQKNKLLQKWVFRKQEPSKINNSNAQLSAKQSDLFLQVLQALIKQNDFQSQEKLNNSGINNNTTANKGYQLVIKSKCCKKKKTVIHVLHLEKSISQISVHTHYFKSSLLQLPNFWEKSLQFSPQSIFSVGCYFYKPYKNDQNSKNQHMNMVTLQQPDRKLSSETKAEQKQKESISSIKFSKQSLSFRLSGKALKHSSGNLPIRKTSEQILHHHRPRYQSIYESKDEEMNIFILSPRKLSEEESPKIKHLQQKPIQFQITDQRGISEQIIEEFILQPEENMSNVSSDGFQMLEENDQLDSIREQRISKVSKEEQRLKLRKKQILEQQLNILQEEIVSLLKSVDRSSTLF